jgi:hypothetical protein
MCMSLLTGSTSLQRSPFYLLLRCFVVLSSVYKILLGFDPSPEGPSIAVVRGISSFTVTRSSLLRRTLHEFTANDKLQT